MQKLAGKQECKCGGYKFTGDYHANWCPAYFQPIGVRQEEKQVQKETGKVKLENTKCKYCADDCHGWEGCVLPKYSKPKQSWSEEFDKEWDKCFGIYSEGEKGIFKKLIEQQIQIVRKDERRKIKDDIIGTKCNPKPMGITKDTRGVMRNYVFIEDILKSLKD